MRRSIRAILALLILAGLAWYIWHARDTLKVALRFDLRYTVPMLLVPIVTIAVNGLIARDLVGEFGVRLTATEWYGLAVINALGNYLPLPQAGAVARGVYLKRVHHLPYTIYAATIVVTYVSSLALSGVIGLAGLALLHAMGRPSPLPLWVAFAGLASSVLMFTPLARFLPVPKRYRNFDSGLHTLRRHHVLSRIILLQTALIAVTATGLWLACRALPGGHEVSWLASAMLGLMAMASGIINVTPGNVGVEQGAAEITARLLHLPDNVGFLASCLFRVMAVIVVFILGPMYSAILAKHPAEASLIPSPGTPGEG